MKEKIVTFPTKELRYEEIVQDTRKIADVYRHKQGL